jgi:hypothetical protein
MNLSRCVAIRIKSWEMWTISRDVKNSSVMQHEMKKSLSSLIRIRIIKSIRTLIDRSHAHDLKSLNRVLVRLLNHQKIRWTISIVKIVKNQNTSFAIVVNSKRWTRTVSYAKWTYMKKMTHRVKRIISNRSREKSSSHQRRDEEQTRCQDVENWSLQFRRHLIQW